MHLEQNLCPHSVTQEVLKTPLHMGHSCSCLAFFCGWKIDLLEVLRLHVRLSIKLFSILYGKMGWVWKVVDWEIFILKGLSGELYWRFGLICFFGLVNLWEERFVFMMR